MQLSPHYSPGQVAGVGQGPTVVRTLIHEVYILWEELSPFAPSGSLVMPVEQHVPLCFALIQTGGPS